MAIQAAKTNYPRYRSTKRRQPSRAWSFVQKRPSAPHILLENEYDSNPPSRHCESPTSQRLIYPRFSTTSSSSAPYAVCFEMRPYFLHNREQCLQSKGPLVQKAATSKPASCEPSRLKAPFKAARFERQRIDPEDEPEGFFLSKIDVLKRRFEEKVCIGRHLLEPFFGLLCKKLQGGDPLGVPSGKILDWFPNDGLPIDCLEGPGGEGSLMERLYTSCSCAISETSRRSKTDVFLSIAFHFCVLKTHETVFNGGSIVDRGRSCLGGTVLGFCLPSRLCANRVPFCSSAKVPAPCLLH